jgi:signal transduction histidine kinase
MDLSHYNITGEKEAAEAAAKNNARLIFIRLPYMLLVFAIVAATIWLTRRGEEHLLIYSAILLAGLLVNIFFVLVVREFRTHLHTQRFLTAAQLVFDMVLAGIITYIEGGLEARTTVLYMFPIMTAALIFGGRAVMMAAILSGATYVSAIVLHIYIVEESHDFSQAVLPMIFYPAVFLLLARVTRYLQHLGTIEAREKAYDSFLSLLAHQLKHPASAVTTIIDAIIHNDDRKVDGTTKRYLEMLKSENENQIRLIDNLLEAAPHEKAVSFEHEVDVSSLVKKVANRLAESNERKKDLMVLPQAQSKTLADVNPIRLSLALTNIFDNAFRYSKSGDVIQYGVSEKSGNIKILIRDSGKGMNQEEIARQLERFANQGIKGIQQGHVGGLGIGLYAAARIASAHGGKLDIHSGAGVGTTVVFTLKKEHKQ